MKRGFNFILLSKRTPYGFAQKYFSIIALTTVFATLLKIMLLVLVVLVIRGAEISVVWFLGGIFVCLTESVISLFARKRLRMIAMEQSAYYKRESLYDAFAGLQVRHTFVARSRLFTDVFLSLLVGATIVTAIILRDYDSIGFYLSLFSSGVVVFLLVFDGIFLMRLLSLDYDFVRFHKKEINKLYWKHCLESIVNKREKSSSEKQIKGNLLEDLVEPMTFFGARRMYCNGVDEFVDVLRCIIRRKPFYVLPQNLKQFLYACPECLHAGVIDVNRGVLRCKNCGKEWKHLSKEGLIFNNNKSKFDDILNWFKWQKTFTKWAVEDGSYAFSSKCQLFFITPKGKKIYLDEGTIIQNKTVFSFFADDGIRLDFDTSNQKGVLFRLKDGLYFNDGKVNYLLKLFNPVDAIKVNFALKEYQENQSL